MARVPDFSLEALAASVSSKTTYAGAAAGLFGWLAQINWIGLSGVLIALIGLAVNFWFQYRRDRRESAEHRARIEALKARCESAINQTGGDR